MKNIFFIALMALSICGCQVNRTQNQYDSAEDAVSAATPIANPTEMEEPVKEEETINVDWQYSESLDKLNDVKHYQALIISTDGRGLFQVGTMDLWGNGRYDYAVGFGWLDGALPRCNDEIIVGIKIPSDSKWRKVPFSCGGNGGAFTGNYQDDIIDLLKSNRQFSVLLGNEEFTFNPSETLKWGSWDSNHIPSHHRNWGE